MEEIDKFSEKIMEKQGYIFMKTIQEYLDAQKMSKHSNLVYPWIEKSNKIIFKIQNFTIITTKSNV